MGCGSSVDAEAMERLRRELEESKLRASEQQNLLRFKIEVLVNMLAMEEKKSESVEKRVETLKWLLHSQGIAEQTLTTILLNAEKADDETKANMMGSVERSISFRNVGLVDLAGALSRAQEEFELYRSDILPAFAGEDGKVVASLSNDEFMKQLYTVTEKLSKADIQIIALRFGDGSGFVSIPEFLEFFTTPSHVRLAKAATSAVRMSLGLLTMAQDEEYLHQDGYEEEEEGLGEDDDEEAELKAKGFLMPQVLSSHLTQNLDRGVRRLLAMWVFVKHDLENSFVLLEAPTIAERPDEGSVDQNSKRGEQLVSLADFKKVLLEKGGVKSGILSKADQNGKITFNQTGKIIPATPVPSRASVDGMPLSPNSKPVAGETPRTGVSSKVPAVSEKKDAKGEAKSSKDSKTPLSKANSTAFSTKSKGIAESKLDEEDDEPQVPALPVIEPLNDVDVDLLSERFELGGYVHYGHFMAYFSELHSALSLTKRKHVTLPPPAANTASPFLVSSEWENLRSSALLKQYAHAPPPVPESPASPASPKLPQAPPATAEAKTLSLKKPEDTKKNETPDNSPRAPPKSAEVVDPASGFSCCGVGRAKPTASAPEPLPPADAKTAWVDPDEEKGGAVVPAENKDTVFDSDSEESTGPKPDPGFNTPKDRTQSKKLSFQPRRVTRDESQDEADVERSGLGKKDRLEPAPERNASRRNHFTRRESGGETNGDENGSTSGGKFTAPRGGDTRWK